MRTLIKTSLVAVAALLLGTMTASAAVVCNDEGDCWRVEGRARYEPELRLRVYEDDWKWKDGENYRWREAGRGHGYWRGGVWVTLD